jgi:hypothetical protein
MKTLTPETFHESIGIQEDDIVLNGSPGQLSGFIKLNNHDSETVFINGLAFSYINSKSNIAENIQLITALLPGEQKTQRITHKLPLNTPPGVYEHTINIGGKQRNVKFIVQQNMDISLTPQQLYFTEVLPEKPYTAYITLSNNGNVPFVIPDIKHVTTLDSDFLCRAQSLAMRDKGNEGFMAFMDSITKNVKADMADWAKISIKEKGKVLQSGESCLIEFTIFLPKNVDTKRDYSGNIRFWESSISFKIKSQESQTEKQHGKSK